MRQMKSMLALAALAVSFAACSDGMTGSEKGDVSGTFQYVGYNKAGVAVVHGTITLAEQNGGVLNGSWNLQATASADRIGPQVGQGELRGTVALSSSGSTEVSLDLNPQWADNNVYLVGQARGATIRGDWTRSTLRGATEGGRFTATKD